MVYWKSEKLGFDGGIFYENNAKEAFSTVTHALVIVKIEDDFLLGYHKWRGNT